MIIDYKIRSRAARRGGTARFRNRASLRGRCVQNVKKTSGSVTLDKAVEYQRGGV